MAGKIYRVAVLLLLLVIIPAISWWYLQGGLQFRLDAIEALEPKAALPLPVDDGSPTVKLMFDRSDQAFDARIDLILERFGQRPDIVAIDLPPDNRLGVRDSLEKAAHLSTYQGSLEEGVFLIDTANHVRRSYALSSDAEVSTMIEHITFLLPREPERDFEFRRSREK